MPRVANENAHRVFIFPLPNELVENAQFSGYEAFVIEPAAISPNPPYVLCWVNFG
jgi:hypothetical protein